MSLLSLLFYEAWWDKYTKMPIGKKTSFHLISKHFTKDVATYWEEKILTNLIKV